ncbi:MULTISPECIES: YfcC family protein [unclassified Streptomyces]|uniref:YfcC family protein n=1 Tax=unclassified Streptomyces TaxID=2593676 RepID=UPI00202F8029|nr:MULTISPECIES: Na+/H+ antiporter NhaC family protein [unclassified Streptomyces]MCM1973005.1 TIGR00366 family protein [Streptomyces sp. G1]MCX5126996.1 TIGR00366 family protein [Streptomyces sp. NBC_00347]
MSATFSGGPALEPGPDDTAPPPATTPADQPAIEAEPAPQPEEPGRNFRFPSAFTVLGIVTLGVWLVAFAIPPGAYRLDDDGRPLPGTYHTVETSASFLDRLRDLFLSPANGLYGVTGEDGATSPGGEGTLMGAAAVFLFILAVGAFITVAMKSGALDAAIGRLAQRLAHRKTLLIIVLMCVFSLGGTTYGMAEETLGFYALVVPLALRLGYDRMTGAAVIMVGAGIGTLASTVNPFATGVASAGAGIGTGDGIVLRLAMWAVLTAIAIAFVLRYARKVARDPAASLVEPRADDGLGRDADDVPPLTGRHKAVIGVFAATFSLMIFSVIPWSDFGITAVPTLGWYFPELAGLFIVAAVLTGLIAGLGEKGTVEAIVSGAGDFIGAALIIVLARGVTVIMNNAQITDTILHVLNTAVEGTGSGIFAALTFLVNIPLAFFVPSSSGHATLAMPIMAPLADFAGVQRSLVVTAYQSASGWVNLITPTSAVVMGGLALAKVRYDRYLRFIWPLMAITLAVTLGFMLLGAVTGR